MIWCVYLSHETIPHKKKNEEIFSRLRKFRNWNECSSFRKKRKLCFYSLFWYLVYHDKKKSLYPFFWNQDSETWKFNSGVFLPKKDSTFGTSGSFKLTREGFFFCFRIAKLSPIWLESFFKWLLMACNLYTIKHGFLHWWKKNNPTLAEAVEGWSCEISCFEFESVHHQVQENWIKVFNRAVPGLFKSYVQTGVAFNCIQNHSVIAQ